MKLKLTPIWILSFFFLTFFVHELHDWAHTIVAALVSGRWGVRGFDNWQFETSASVSNGQRALATLAGPLVNLSLALFAWMRMANEDDLSEQGMGCSLFLATMPVPIVVAACSGGGDFINGLKLLFPGVDSAHRHLVSIVGLVILLIILVPPVIRAFRILPGWLGKFVFLPVFLVLPGFVDHWLVGGVLNGLLASYESDESLAYVWCILWTAAMLAGWLFTRKGMMMLLIDREITL